MGIFSITVTWLTECSQKHFRGMVMYYFHLKLDTFRIKLDIFQNRVEYFSNQIEFFSNKTLLSNRDVFEIKLNIFQIATRFPRYAETLRDG